MLKPYGIVDEDVESRAMGSQGEDCILSPAAQRYTPWKSEVKHVENLNVNGVFWSHFAKYEKFPNHLKILFHRKNHKDMLVTLRMADFLEIYRKTLR